MRRFLLAAVLGLGAVGLSAGPASAHHLLKCHCYKKCACICCKPYNAFSPVVFGNFCFEGCCPSFGCCQPPAPPPCPEPCGGCADGSCGGCGGPGGPGGYGGGFAQLPSPDAVYGGGPQGAGPYGFGQPLLPT